MRSLYGRGALRRLSLSIFSLCVVSVTARAQDTDWRAVTRADLTAARDLLRDNHPAAQAIVGDRAFLSALDSGFVATMRLADKVTTAGGYRAVLRRFATSFDDGHISASFSGPAPSFGWAGFVVRRVSGQFVVAHVDSSVTDIRVGDRVVRCDGESIEDRARRRLGHYRAVWSVEADIIRSAFYLFIDDGNPFESLPTSCEFARGKVIHRAALRWRPTTPAAITPYFAPTVQFMGVAPIGARVIDSVYWIAMSEMTDTVDATIAALANDRRGLAGARAIVIDLRQNGGGSSAKGEDLIRVLFGQAAVTRAQQAFSGDGGAHWRASPFVAQSLREFLDDRVAKSGATSDDAKYWRGELTAVEQSIAQQQLFAPPLRSRPSAAAPSMRRERPSGLARKTVVLTDHFCFSSCLILVAELRALGVTQIGLATNASRRYMEVRHTPLPSGFAQFSTLQKVSFGAPSWLGPYPSDIALPATVDSPESVEQWAIRTAVQHAHANAAH